MSLLKRELKITQAWLCMSVITALGRQRSGLISQFEASQGKISENPISTNMLVGAVIPATQEDVGRNITVGGWPRANPI
jgi:hypothetical protein